MTAEEALRYIKEYIDRFENNLQPPRGQSDEDWRRGAWFVRTQIRALITEHIEPHLSVEAERNTHTREWVNV